MIPKRTISTQQLYRSLGLESFTKLEMQQIYDRVPKMQHNQLSQQELHDYLFHRPPTANSTQASLTETNYTNASEFREIWQALGGNDTDRSDNRQQPHLTRDQFVQALQERASSVDWHQTWPIIVSMLLVGTSVGVTTPAMPFVVQQLQLTAGQYGTVVSAFGLAKMMGNIPAAVLVERHGRKPYMTYSLGVIAVAVGGMGWAANFEQLYLCRLFTGLGVAALSTAGTLMITDNSTPLNRASTLAPIMSAFAAGTALGPALGGYMVDAAGLQATFATVACSYVGVATLNRFLLKETLPKLEEKSLLSTATANTMITTTTSPSISTEVQNALGQWWPLFQDPKLRTVLFMNMAYWISLSGSQMTLLPLVLTEQMNLSAFQVGQVYMGMSMIQIVGNPIFASGADRFGKVPAMVAGCTLISTAMMALPSQLTHETTLAPCLAFWAAGSSMLSTAPVSYTSDIVKPSHRAQAIAMLRTGGDVGFLIGASMTGVLADLTGNLVAMQSSAAMLLSATSYFALRQYQLTHSSSSDAKE
jgi:MFS family permease